MMRLSDYIVTSRAQETASDIVLRMRRTADEGRFLFLTIRDAYPARTDILAYRRAAETMRELDGRGALAWSSFEQIEGRPYIIAKDNGEVPLPHWLELTKLREERSGRAEESFEVKLKWAAQAAASLAEVHRAGFIHNSLSPDNLWVRPESLKVSFSGFYDSLRAGRREEAPGNERRTAGFLPYMAPEQTGRTTLTPTESSDIYSLGAIMYEAFAGVPPFRREEPADLLYAHLAEMPAPLDSLDLGIDPRLSGIVLRCLGKTPEERWASAGQLAEALTEYKLDAETVWEGWLSGRSGKSAESKEAMEELKESEERAESKEAKELRESEERAESKETKELRESEDGAESAERSLREGKLRTALDGLAEGARYYEQADRLLAGLRGEADADLREAVDEACLRAEFGAGDEAAAYARFERALAEAGSRKERVGWHLRLIRLETELARPHKAVMALARCLEELDVEWSPTPNLASLLLRFAKLGWSFRGKRYLKMLQLRLCEDERIELAMKAIAYTMEPALLSNWKMWLQGLTLIAELSRRYGRTEATRAFFSHMALLHNYLTRRLSRAVEWDKLAGDNSKSDDWVFREIRNMNRAVCYDSWRHFNPKVLDELILQAEEGLKTADRPWQGAKQAFWISVLLMNCGRPIDEIDSLLQRSAKIIAAESIDILLVRYASGFGKLLARLQGRRMEVDPLAGAIARLDHASRSLRPEQERFIEKSELQFDIIACYWNSEYEQAYRCLERAEAMMENGKESVQDFRALGLYRVLILAELYPIVMQSERRRFLKDIRGLIGRLKRLSNQSPTEYRHKYLMAMAEYARITGNAEEAERCYEAACVSTVRDGHVHNTILAAENAGRFALEQGKPLLARSYLLQAYESSLLWGARGKTGQLERLYGHMLFTGGASFSEEMDYDAILKSVQAISGEIQTEHLLPRLMATMLRTAGAERGSLAVMDSQELRIAAVGTERNVLLISEELDESDAACAEIVRLAARTKEPIILKDASQEGIFTGLPYIRKHGIRSLLCVPLMKNGSLVGVVHMENNLSAGVFKLERLNVLKLLAAQCAISIENAQLYSNVERMNETLEERVEERTRSLELSMKESAAAWAEASIQSDRTRIASDVHDIVGHTITSTLLQLEAIKRLAGRDPEGGLQRIDDLQRMLRSGLNDIRLSIHMLKDSESEPLGDSLSRLIEETSRSTGVRIEADIGELPELPGQYRHVLYHALQEGLTNGIRHGAADRFGFRLSFGDGILRFELSNEGAARKEIRFGFGLTAMQQRVENLQGSLTVGTDDAERTRLAIELPYSPKGDNRRGPALYSE
ncbi:GAF domain-containing protein [Cohnella fermenti]|uniref:GAF domain-containing protein n=1 Tax=Cohnella fermenti TaxID=2565925 RepID=A0A4S4BKK1_9BACL|nr:GAF domain-containing protein [Cohnella fermenti]THF75260.1 GAF domain-containing protein [Cohnella fermenti]